MDKQKVDAIVRKAYESCFEDNYCPNYTTDRLYEKIAELVIQEYAAAEVRASMSNPEYAQAMDAHYEQKWAHRFD